MSDDEMTVSQAAAQLGLTAHAVHYAIRRGHLPASRLGHFRVLRRADVDTYAKEREGKPRVGRPRARRGADGAAGG